MGRHEQGIPTAEIAPGPTFGALLWLTRTDWPAVQSAAIAAEAGGFDQLWVPDHLLADTGSQRAPVLDGWSVLAALGSVTSRIGIGTLVSPVSLRHPALIAKAAVTVDRISRGRLTLGLGAGWFEAEHRIHGLTLGDPTDRSDRLDEAVSIIRPLIDGRDVDMEGRHMRIVGGHHAPRPVGRIPLLIGGHAMRTLATAARAADLWHDVGPLPDLRSSMARLDAACERARRDPIEVRRSTNRWVALRSDPQAGRAVVAASLEAHGVSDIPAWRLAVGRPDHVARDMREYLEAGFEHLILSFRDPFDLETMYRFSELRAELAATHGTAL